MPLFEFICPVDGFRFEVLLPRLPEDETSSCPKCGARSPRIWSRVTMRPDTAWSGVMDKNLGYLTSDSQRNRLLKERNLVEMGDRSDGEGMRKAAEEGARARKDREAKDRRSFLEESFAGSGLIDSFGEIRPEAVKKLSDQPILSPKDERLK